MPQRRSIFYGALLLTGANLAMRGVSMLFQIYLSNRIGAAGIGLLQLILTVGMLAATVGGGGVRVASTYLVAEEYGRRRPGGMRRAVAVCSLYALLLSLAAAAALYALSDLLALRWIGDLRAAPSLRILALSLPISSLWSVLAGYFTASSKIGRLVAVELVNRVVTVFLTMWLLVYWAGGELSRICSAIVGGGTAVDALSLAVLALLYRQDLRTLGRVPPKLFMGRRLLRLSPPLAVNECIRAGLGTAEHLLIPRGLAQSGGSSEASLAAYGTIHGMVFPVMMFPSALLYSIADLLVPELARCRASDNRARIAYLTDRSLRMCLLFACAVSGLLLTLSDPLGLLLFHSAEAGYYLRAFAPLVLFLYLDAMVDGMHKGLGQQAACMRYNTITSLLDVVLLTILLPRYGIAGYFFTFTVTHALNFYLSIARLIRVTDYRPTLRNPLMAGLCTAAALILSQLFLPAFASLPTAVATLGRGGFFLVVFTALLAITGTFTRQDGQWLRRVLTGA